MDILKKLTEEFPSIREDRAQNIINLIDEGNTIPFIARYRKEMTGSCDDQVLREFNDRLLYLRNLEKRKEEVAKSITDQGKMTEEIRQALDAATTLTEVEDIYRPYKQKKKTRASVAIEKGLQPLADFILAQDKNADVRAEAEKYVDEEKGVVTADEAIAGAKDIIAEIVSDDANVRKKLRNLFMKNGEIQTKLVNADKEGAKTYEMYADYSEPVAEIKISSKSKLSSMMKSPSASREQVTSKTAAIPRSSCRRRWRTGTTASSILPLSARSARRSPRARASRRSRCSRST